MVCHSCSIYHHHYIDTLVLLIGIYLSFCSGNTLERIRYSIHQHHISNKIHLCLHICHQTWEYSLGCILCSVLYGISNSVATGKNYIWGHILQHNPYILLKSIKDIHQFHKIMKQGYIRMGLYMRHTFHQHNCIRIFLEYSFDQTYNILFNTQCKYPWNHKPDNRDQLCSRNHYPGDHTHQNISHIFYFWLHSNFHRCRILFMSECKGHNNMSIFRFYIISNLQ